MTDFVSGLFSGALIIGLAWAAWARRQASRLPPLTLVEYQERARLTAVYPAETFTQALGYLALGLTGEAGEVAELTKKIIRGKRDPETQKKAIVDEIGDVLWYVSEIARHVGYRLDIVAERNLAKLGARAAEGRLADKRKGRVE